MLRSTHQGAEEGCGPGAHEPLTRRPPLDDAPGAPIEGGRDGGRAIPPGVTSVDRCLVRRMHRTPGRAAAAGRLPGTAAGQSPGSTNYDVDQAARHVDEAHDLLALQVCAHLLPSHDRLLDVCL